MRLRYSSLTEVTQAMAGTWQSVRVFISSTFRDMHAERDHLVKVVFPALRERLEKHRLYLIDIYMRWKDEQQHSKPSGNRSSVASAECVPPRGFCNSCRTVSIHLPEDDPRIVQVLQLLETMREALPEAVRTEAARSAASEPMSLRFDPSHFHFDRAFGYNDGRVVIDGQSFSVSVAEPPDGGTAPWELADSVLTFFTTRFYEIEEAIRRHDSAGEGPCSARHGHRSSRRIGH